ncbi:MAG: hypothetical protein ABIC91_00760 [Nanoarchaeota archaeon]|nr:hypothetical protein [Nanoarchaeota archaeon]MBU1029902.1 hypothetical protein [Nanoarchaeota archaeon]MBU1849825.1 hypothetical protein [Nanoarchaeota archaeon]
MKEENILLEDKIQKQIAETGIISKEIIRFYNYSERTFLKKIHLFIDEAYKRLEKGIDAHIEPKILRTIIKKSFKIGKYLEDGVKMYVGGMFFKEDQETIGKIIHKESWQITATNSVLETAYAGVLALGAITTGTIGLLAPIAIYGAIQIAKSGVSIAQKKAFASISIAGLTLNSTTYIKRFQKHFKETYSEPTQFYHRL